MQVCRTGYSNSFDEKHGESSPWTPKQGKPTKAGGPETQVANGVPKQSPQFWGVPKEPNPSFGEDMRGKEKSLKTRFVRYDKEFLAASEDWPLSERWGRTFVHTQEHEVWAHKNLLAAAPPTEEAEWEHSVWVIMYFQAWGVLLRLGIKRQLHLFCIFKENACSWFKVPKFQPLTPSEWQHFHSS